MGKICKECGYQTTDNTKDQCPFCGAVLKNGEVQPENAGGVAVKTKKPGISLTEFKMPLFMIALALVVLVYILMEPEKVGRQVQNVLDSMQSMSESSDGGTENGQMKQEDGHLVGTDSKGNEILLDFTIPGVQQQPDYVLAESSRSTWTITTNDNGLNLRDGPSTDYNIIGFLEEGVTVTAWGYSEEGPQNWIIVEYNGQYGWACTDFMTQNS